MSEPNSPAGSRDPDTAPLPRVPPSGTAVMPSVHGQLPPVSHPSRPSAGQSQRSVPAPYPPGAGHHPGPRPQRPSRGVRRYLLPAVALVAVAVLSGLLWWLLNRPSQDPTTAPPATTSATAGKYQFTKAHGKVVDTDCVAHSYGKTKQFLDKTRCRLLTRTLYTTRVNGVEVFSSVSAVRMADAGAAARLEQLTDRNNTGNVTDLVKDGVTAPGAPKELAGGGYASSRDGSLVTIVESKAAEGKKLSDQVLTRVSRDALRLG
ncbi:MAG: hypothetical protein ACRDRL_30570 [Sciscionella sp.]